MIYAKVTAFLAFVLVGIGASASGVLAQVEFHPWFFVGQEYTDNLLLTSENEQADWGTLLEPGFNLTYGSRSVDLSLDYSLSYLGYQDNTDSNIDEFEDMQRADLNVVFFQDRPFTLTLEGLINRQTLDDLLNGFEFNEAVNRSTVYQTTVLPTYRLQLSPTLFLGFDYVYDRYDYADPTGNDIEEHIGGIVLAKQLSARTEVFSRYSYLIHQPGDNSVLDRPFDQQDYLVGLKQQFGPRLSGDFEIGLSQVEYDDGRASDNALWSFDLRYEFSGALAFSLLYDQSYVTSATLGLYAGQDASLEAVYSKGSTVAHAEIFWRQWDYELSARKDESVGISFDFKVSLTRVFSTIFDAEYERAKFTDLVAEDIDRYTAGLALGYEYRRIVASLGYRYRLSDSDLGIRDYTNNIFTLSARVQF